MLLTTIKKRSLKQYSIAVVSKKVDLNSFIHSSSIDIKVPQLQTGCTRNDSYKHRGSPSRPIRYGPRQFSRSISQKVPISELPTPMLPTGKKWNCKKMTQERKNKHVIYVYIHSQKYSGTYGNILRTVNSKISQ